MPGYRSFYIVKPVKKSAKKFLEKALKISLNNLFLVWGGIFTTKDPDLAKLDDFLRYNNPPCIVQKGLFLNY